MGLERLLPWLCSHDEKLISNLLQSKGFSLGVREEECYAHPLIVALDYALRRGVITEWELVKLGRALYRPIIMYRDWQMNVWQHNRIYNLKERVELGGYVWNW